MVDSIATMKAASMIETKTKGAVRAVGPVVRAGSFGRSALLRDRETACVVRCCSFFVGKTWERVKTAKRG